MLPQAHFLIHESCGISCRPISRAVALTLSRRASLKIQAFDTTCDFPRLGHSWLCQIS